MEKKIGPSHWLVIGLFALYVALNPVAVWGQGANVIDSLKEMLVEIGPDTQKVNLLNDIAYYSVEQDVDQALAYADEALSLAEQLQFLRGIAKAHYIAAYALMWRGDYEEALTRATVFRDMCVRSGMDYRLPAAWTLIGSIYRQMGHHSQALDAFLSAVALTRQWGDSLDLGYALLNLATTYSDLGQQKKEQSILLEAIPIFERYGDRRSLIDAWINLGGSGLPGEEGMAYLRRAIAAAEQTGYTSALAYAWHNVAAYLLDSLQQFDEAIGAFRRSIAYSRQLRNGYEEASATIGLGHAFLKAGMLDSAIAWLEHGLYLADSLGLRQQRLEALDGLRQAFAEKGKYRKAYALLEDQLALADSLFSERLVDRLAEANARYEVQKREAQLAAQQLEIERERSRRRQVIGVAAVLLMLVVVWLQRRYYRQRRLKEQAAREAARLKTINEHKSQLFAFIAHELRTPLTLIISPLEEVLCQLKQVQLERPLRLVYRQSVQLLELVEQMMSLIRMDEGQLELQCRAVALADFFADLYEQVAPAFRSKRIELEWHIDEWVQQALVWIDDEKVLHILLNLLGNALKFTPSQGKVCMRASGGSAGLCVSISDTGPGMTPQEQAHIFEQFFQGESGRAHGGSGLGLTYVARLVQLMGATLDVESQQGKGTTFHLQLPIERVERVTHSRRTAQVSHRLQAASRVSVQPSAAQRASVLVVEDHPEMMDWLVSLLEPTYRVYCAFDGQEALQSLERLEKVDLVLSDLMMPQLDGFALRKKLIEHPRWQHIPFLFITASRQEEDVVSAFQLGIADYLRKPFHPEELRARVRNALVRGQYARRLSQQENGVASEAPDRSVLQRAISVVYAHLDDPAFKVADLASALHMSKRQLARVIGKLTGMTPVAFILELRLQRAYDWLREGKYKSISEVRLAVGIVSASYFTAKFKERFGILPSEVKDSVNG